MKIDSKVIQKALFVNPKSIIRAAVRKKVEGGKSKDFDKQRFHLEIEAEVDSLASLMNGYRPEINRIARTIDSFLNNANIGATAEHRNMDRKMRAIKSESRRFVDFLVNNWPTRNDIDEDVISETVRRRLENG